MMNIEQFRSLVMSQAKGALRDAEGKDLPPLIVALTERVDQVAVAKGFHIEQRLMVLERLFKDIKPQFAMLVYDGYVTIPPGPRKDALVFVQFYPGVPAQVGYLPYTRDPDLTFEPYQEPPEGSVSENRYPMLELTGPTKES